MDKLKIAQVVLLFSFIMMFKYCIPKRTGCNINEENSLKIISGTVIKKIKDAKNHNYIKLTLRDKSVIYGGTEYTSVCGFSDVGDSLYKPKGSLIVTLFKEGKYEFLHIDISLKCDTLPK